ncbi:MAG: RrF2 family transcriptional regulator [Acidimicrobiales bacterium]
MNMTLSKRGDYVMRSAISLARAFEAGGARKIREVVAETEVPKTFASQILADLVRADLAVSKSGRDGGYRLARPPAEISVLDVIEAAEGTLRAERCALGEGPCRWEAVCPLHETWSQATAALRELLSRTTLADVAKRDAAIEAGTYAVPSDAHRSHPVAVEVSDVVQVELGAPSLHRALARVAGMLDALIATALRDAARAGGARATPEPPREPLQVVEASLAPIGPGPGPIGRPRSGGYALPAHLAALLTRRLEPPRGGRVGARRRHRAQRAADRRHLAPGPWQQRPTWHLRAREPGPFDHSRLSPTSRRDARGRAGRSRSRPRPRSMTSPDKTKSPQCIS